MPPARSSPSSRSTENVLSMSTSEIRLLLLAHLCIDKESGKVNYEKLATRANITVASAGVMFRSALRKLAKENPEPGTGDGQDAGHSTDAASPSSKPRRGRAGGRPKKTTTEWQTTGGQAEGEASEVDKEFEDA